MRVPVCHGWVGGGEEKRRVNLKVRGLLDSHGCGCGCSCCGSCAWSGAVARVVGVVLVRIACSTRTAIWLRGHHRRGWRNVGIHIDTSGWWSVPWRCRTGPRSTDELPPARRVLLRLVVTQPLHDIAAEDLDGAHLDRVRRICWPGCEDTLEDRRVGNPAGLEIVPVLVTRLELAGELVRDKEGIKGIAHLPALFRIDGNDILCFCNCHASLEGAHPLRHVGADDVESECLLLDLVRLVRPKDVLQVRILSDQPILGLLPLLRAGNCLFCDVFAFANRLELVSNLSVRVVVQAEKGFTFIERGLGRKSWWPGRIGRKTCPTSSSSPALSGCPPFVTFRLHPCKSFLSLPLYFGRR